MTDTPDSGAADQVRVPTAAKVMKAAAMGQCPRCGSRTLFKSFVNFADRCTACGLDYAGFNVGDGPAAFLTLAIGTVLAVAAILFDQAVHPPFWVHFLIWVPLTIAMVIYGLRVAKGALLAVEYWRDAREAGSLGTDGSRRSDHSSSDS